MKIASILDPYNKDIKSAAEYHGRMAANMLDIQYINASKISSIVRAAFALGAAYQKNIFLNQPNIIE
ncbi:MAG: hypothetical protein QM660_10700 [Dysgonomonas sp.]